MSETEVFRYESPQAVAEAAAERLLEVLGRLLADQDQARLALTGGSMGSAIWSSVAAKDTAEIDWSRVHVWWGDERYLPLGDADRNDTQNDEAGLSRLPLTPAHVHRVLGPDESADAEDSAAAYAASVREEGSGAFDIVLLGVGPDGHVASLFPGHRAQLSTGIAVAVHDSPKPPADRVSLTFEALGRADRVWFLVAGAHKADAVRQAIHGAPPAQSSAAQVHGRQETLWLVDTEAAGEL